MFLGPTLAIQEAQQILDAIYLPPAAQGSVVLAIERFRPSTVLLIDGCFQDQPAVRHKELLWALSLGIGVVGAASMGALRAAELCQHGMVGIGLIYRWYRRFQLAPDDAVAVLHGPPEVDSGALTESLIDLRMTFRLAERRGHTDRSLRQRLEFAAARLNFRDRTITQVVNRAMHANPASDPQMHSQLVRTLEGSFTSQKAEDARKALLQLRAWQPGGAQLPKSFTATRVLIADLEAAGINPQILMDCAKANLVF